MLIKLWEKYEALVLNFTDIHRQWYSYIGLVICIVPFIIFNYTFYHYILGFDNRYLHIYLIILALGKGRVLLALIMLKNKCHFGKGHNYYSIGISIVGILLAVGVGIFLIIKDLNGGFEKQENVKIYKKSEINTNILNNSNRYDYLIQEHKNE